MKFSIMFVSLISFLPAFAHSQYGDFGPVPDCNCDSGKVVASKNIDRAENSKNGRPQKVEVAVEKRGPVLTQAEMKIIQRKMAEKIVAHAGSEADVRALNQSEALGFAVPVLEATLDSQGNVIHIEVVRWPSNGRARYTVDLAFTAIHKAAPYTGITNGVPGLKIMLTFIFNNDNKFYLRALGK